MTRTLDEKKQRILSFKGPVVANVTPFNKDGSVNEEMIPFYLKYLVDIGVKGAYVHGTTGEGISLGHEEKESLTRAWVKARDSLSDASSFLLVINVSSCVGHESKSHARLCQELGVDAIAFVPPFYYRPTSVQQIVKYGHMISAAAPDIPLIYYHFPEITHVDFPLHDLLTHATKHLPAFVGVKYTSKDMAQLARINQHFGDRVKFFFGYEETMLTACAIGLDSGFCAMFNFPQIVRSYNDMIAAVDGGDIVKARAAHAAIESMARRLEGGDHFIVNLKNIMNEIGLKVGSVREPMFETH